METNQELPEFIPAASKCLICSGPAYCQPDNRFTHFCQECKKCPICHNYGDPISNESMTLEELDWAVQYKTPAQHFSCMLAGVKDSIESNPQIITQKHLNYLNAIHLMFGINEELSKESNIVEATFATNSFMVGKSSKQIYLHLRRVEAIAAVLSIAIKRDKKSVELELDATERTKYARATSKQDVKPPAQKPVKKAMSVRDRGIQGLMAVGLSEEEAAETYDKAHAKVEA